MNTLPKVAAEMALHVLAYNLTHVMNIIGIKPLMAAGQAVTSVTSNAPAARSIICKRFEPTKNHS